MKSLEEKALIQACKSGDAQAQNKLYESYAPVLFAICRRYLSRYEDAEDVLVEAFFKIFTQIHQFSFLGSFEGWMKKIVVNECLMFLRKQMHIHADIEDQTALATEEVSPHSTLVAGDILQLLDKLPTGYRTIFNMYVVEGYKHREIADLLGISINTSKSQLILAKKRMQELLEEINF